ncbi:RHS repeat protein [Mycetohabitans sp. B2]|uniref:RHS repeat-associated core domain-containing protein n=1 Tax=Mycetohabitans sp. B2 TaxID=2841274 RepID=UPI001F1E63D2|nr:RHS repeat-associated core domain-containing protein [Mycetohabitans sp. B2]MCF7696844.1 RHS repeat protein [Mycetohabitans sp. B2]
MNKTLYNGTPTITVANNRGLTVRTLQYNRTTVGSDMDERITTVVYSMAGFVLNRTDPRLGSQPSSMHDVPLNNVHYHSDLAGRALRTDSVDAGTHWRLFDVNGQPVWQRDARGTVTCSQYDKLSRLTQITEQPVSQTAPVGLTILTYGDNDSTLTREDAQSANLCGVMNKQLDTAGQLTTSAMTLTGQPQTQTRQLLLHAEKDPDWSQPTSGQLDNTHCYTTCWTYNAMGMPLTQTDAAGNVQQTAYDVAGRQASVSLRPVNSTAQTLLASIDYNAAGQVQKETAGNAVTTTYGYEPQSQRLISIVAQRSCINRQGQPREACLQAIRYTYDPVGNIIGSEEATQPVSYYRNQQINAFNTYRYDALYQLIQVSGRENANAGSQVPAVLQPIVPLPQDDSLLTNYTRQYHYDRGGNLTQIQHQGASTYTRSIVVSDTSNHAVMQNQAGSLKPADIDGRYFDACGNSLQLQPDSMQPLMWNGRNQLYQVVLLERDTPALNDREVYQYDARGIRVRKTTIFYADEKQNQKRTTVIYLPGLEIRKSEIITLDDEAAPKVTEDLKVIHTGNIGRTQVRILHWDKGQPAEIHNDQLRYSLDDANGSVTLELDSAANVLTREEYYPFGGTSVSSAKNQSEAKYKFIHYSGKERDLTGLYNYGYRYYMSWLGRWLNPDPIGTVGGLNLYRMVENNPIVLTDKSGLMPIYSVANRVQSGHTTPLLNKGIINLASESEARIPFQFLRRESTIPGRAKPESFGPTQILSATEQQKREVLGVGNGSQITSYDSNAGITQGSYWGPNKLKFNTEVISIANATAGTAAIRIDFSQIENGHPILVSSGGLSGCTMMFSVQERAFYAYHAGISTPSEDWKTSIQGVESILMSSEDFKYSIKEWQKPESDIEPFDNNLLSDFADAHKSSLIVYNGKPGSEVERIGSNSHGKFNYYDTGMTYGQGLALLSYKRGHVLVKMLGEVGSLSLHKNTGQHLTYKFKAKRSMIVKEAYSE